jgi:hypothetical protein
MNEDLRKLAAIILTKDVYDVWTTLIKSTQSGWFNFRYKGVSFTVYVDKLELHIPNSSESISCYSNSFEDPITKLYQRLFNEKNQSDFDLSELLKDD